MSEPNAHAKHTQDNDLGGPWCWLCMEAAPCKDGRLEGALAQLRDVTAERDRLIALCKRSLAHIALVVGTGRPVHPTPTKHLYDDLLDATGIKPKAATHEEPGAAAGLPRDKETNDG